jgi:hypothetical protein
MELCQLSLATYLNGPMGDVRLEATDFAWQVASGLDYLHSNQLIASLDPKNVLLAQEYGRHVVKLQVASDFDEVCKFESNQSIKMEIIGLFLHNFDSILTAKTITTNICCVLVNSI